MKQSELPLVYCEGLVVSIIKKPNLDPSIPQNYRPITISSVCSKVLEYYVLDQCDGYNARPCQFGFVPNRNTTMAATLAHDVSAFCVASGSPVYLCSLDVEGAFDTLPLSVLFKKAIGIIPDRCWCLMYYGYQQNVYTNPMERYIKR